MLYRTLRLKRIWIPALLLTSLGIAGWAWAARGPKYTDPSQVPYTAGRPSPGSLHSAPSYGTRVSFEDSTQAALRWPILFLLGRRYC